MVTISDLDDPEFLPTTPSFKPFARSLSHELRTPMHGVIGMLDVMQATVQEAIESHQCPNLRKIFYGLRENIEVVQGEMVRSGPVRKTSF